MKANVYLIGFMGSGKTEVGRRLAEREGHRFIDLDGFIEQRVGTAISKIFSREGERAFRQYEANAIEELAAQRGLIVATGGGSVISHVNRQRLRGSGHVIALHVDLDAVRPRLVSDRDRPLLRKAMGEEGALERLYRERLPLYQDADVVIDTTDKTIDDVVSSVQSWLRSR